MPHATPNSSQSDAQLSYRELARFFVPLGLTPLLFSSTHSIVAAALARLPLPEANLAVYAVVQALVNAVKAPCLASMQVTAALVGDRTSFRRVMTLIWSVCAFFLAALALLALTPAGEWVLVTLIGIHDPVQLALARTGMRIVLWLPIVETLRNSMQGLAIALKSTNVLPVATAVRVAATSLFALWALQSQLLTGIVVGSVAWVAGIGIEGVLVALYLSVRFGSPGRAAARLAERDGAAHGGEPVTPRRFFTFFAPLGLMMSVTAGLMPVLQAGLARGPAPTETLAAFGVAWSLRTVLAGPLQMLHHVPLAYVTGLADPRLRTVRRFCYAVGAAVSATLLGLAWTPAGPWLVGTVLGIPPSLVPLVLATCAAFALFPLITAWRESYWGVLMREQRTAIIGAAKVANLIAVVLAVALLFGPLRDLLPVPGAVAGALAVTCGELVESLLVWRRAVHRQASGAATAAQA